MSERSFFTFLCFVDVFNQDLIMHNVHNHTDAYICKKGGGVLLMHSQVIEFVECIVL